MTRLFVEHTNYEYVPPVDISIYRLHEYDNPIIVCAREGQKIRLQGLQRKGFVRKSIRVVGWWDLSGETVDSLHHHDAVFVLDPERIGEPAAKAQWDRIIECMA